MSVDRLTVIGIGLIGGSFARAVRRGGAVGEIVGCSIDGDELRSALDLGVIDRAEADAAAAARGADVVMIATPVGAMPAVFRAIADVLGEQAIVSDAGSVKGSVVAAARAHLGRHFPRFVAGHPIAGTERSGVAASLPDLYVDQRVILTPEPETHADAIAAVRALWEAAGARVEEMPASEHDAILAHTSHLPHMVAYALVNCLGGAEPASELLRFAAGGFRDLTRIASSHPVMWRDIALANRDELLRALRGYRASLGEIVAAIEKGDAAALEEMFARARALRERLGNTGQAHAQSDIERP
ncbi:MAG: prephenate dehydrogenase/arogenate dehydrogenase family protein [Gammaproteobacteria bacterium]|nr:prephenate dehydrogenase/arogenate dehydrogenase family protein [Gammaproteobacteria bacterium]MCG3144402.1 Cyclohexadienyl dehydrogenase [Gammaproteobacteria bacterium]